MKQKDTVSNAQEGLQSEPQTCPGNPNGINYILQKEYVICQKITTHLL